ncbi:MAG: hypothetical protein L6R30_09090 [Thermoanaerobaculia bacterium]|nr:hypothetical protein [Thermoanaerobaculia bacterium]
MNSRTVYLDQNLIGHFLNSGADWRQHPIAARLLEAQRTGSAQVWLSPTHVMELSLMSLVEARQKQAQVMLEMIAARRMWSGFDFFILESFGNWLNSLIPEAFNPKPFFERSRRLSERLALGNLGLLAATQDVLLGCGVETIRRAKAETHLIHARIAANPDAYVTSLVAAVKAFSTTTRDLLGTGGMSLEDMQREAQELAAVARKPTQATLALLQKERIAIASAYGSADIGNAVLSILSWPCALHLTFAIPDVVAGWSKVMETTGCLGLPKEVATADPVMLATDLPTARAVLHGCIRAAATAELAIAYAGYYTVLREMEVCLNQGRLPRPSLTLDVHHALAALRFDVFVTQDEVLYENMRSFVKRGNLRTVIVHDEKQLTKALL